MYVPSETLIALLVLLVLASGITGVTLDSMARLRDH